MAARAGLSVARRDKFIALAASLSGCRRHPGPSDEILHQPGVDLGQPVAMAADRPPNADDIDAEPAESPQMAGSQRAGQSRRQTGRPGGDKKGGNLGLA